MQTAPLFATWFPQPTGRLSLVISLSDPACFLLTKTIKEVAASVIELIIMKSPKALLVSASKYFKIRSYNYCFEALTRILLAMEVTAS